MEFVHHIGKNIDEALKAEFLSAGFDLPLELAVFDISENDPRWPAVQKLVAKYGCIDFVSTKFTAAERHAAKYLVIGPTWHHGYPEPSDDGGFREATFDLSDYCPSCGIGLKQIAPFRLSKAPKWGSKSVLQLNWMFDQYFAKPETWESVFRPFGIGAKPVVLNRTGQVVETIVQLDIPTLVELDTEGYSFTICPVCGRKKYDIVKRGFYPGPISFEGFAAKSCQYFGSGASANHLVLASQKLYGAIVEAGVKGIAFFPCKQ